MTDIKSDGGYRLMTIVRFCITRSVLYNESPKKLFCGSWYLIYFMYSLRHSIWYNLTLRSEIKFQGNCACEPSFRYVFPGSEAEKCRPLDHRWQIPFIHSAQFIISNQFLYIQHCSSYFLHLTPSSMSWYGADLSVAHAPLPEHLFEG